MNNKLWCNEDSLDGSPVIRFARAPNQDGERIYVNVDRITHVSFSSKYAEVHLVDSKEIILGYFSLREFVKCYPKFTFLHRALIVRKDLIERTEIVKHTDRNNQYIAHLKTGACMPISRRVWAEKFSRRRNIAFNELYPSI